MGLFNDGFSLPSERFLREQTLGDLNLLCQDDFRTDGALSPASFVAVTVNE